MALEVPLQLSLVMPAHYRWKVPQQEPMLERLQLIRHLLHRNSHPQPAPVTWTIR